jgi:O-antigen ligase
MIKSLINLYKKITPGVWILTLLHLLFVSRTTLFSIRRTVGDYSVMVSSSTVMVFVVIILSILVIFDNSLCFKHANKTISRLIFFYLVCFSSCIWVGFQTVIIFKSLEVLCNLYLMYIIAMKIGNIRLLLLYIIVLSTITAYVEVLDGILKSGIWFIHTNSYSMAAMIGFFLGIQAIRNHIIGFKEIRYLLLLNLIAILGGTSSATYISFMIGLITVYSSGPKGVKFTKLFLCLILSVIIFYLAYDILLEFIFQGKTEDDIKTGTGRSAIFEAAINSWQDSPLIGHGYIIGQRNLSQFGLGTDVLSCHNTFLAILVDTGLLGMSFFLYFLITWINNLIRKCKNNLYAVILLPALLASLINCFSYPAIGSDWSYVGSLIFLMYIMTNLFINRIKY